MNEHLLGASLWQLSKRFCPHDQDPSKTTPTTWTPALLSLTSVKPRTRRHLATTFSLTVFKSDAKQSQFFVCLNLPNATVIFFGYLTHRLSGLCSRKSKTKKKKNLFICVKEEFICSQKKNQPPKNLVWLLFFFPPFFPLNLDLPIPPPHSHR